MIYHGKRFLGCINGKTLSSVQFIKPTSHVRHDSEQLQAMRVSRKIHPGSSPLQKNFEEVHLVNGS